MWYLDQKQCSCPYFPLIIILFMIIIILMLSDSMGGVFNFILFFLAADEGTPPSSGSWSRTLSPASPVKSRLLVRLAPVVRDSLRFKSWVERCFTPSWEATATWTRMPSWTTSLPELRRHWLPEPILRSTTDNGWSRIV